jgi:hypothetical protein
MVTSLSPLPLSTRGERVRFEKKEGRASRIRMGAKARSHDEDVELRAFLVLSTPPWP